MPIPESVLVKEDSSTDTSGAVAIVVLPGTNQQYTFTFSERLSIGRADDADIQLRHPLVSRHHTEVRIAPGGHFLIRDLGSRNGTQVNGRDVRDTEVLADSNASVQVGPYVLTFTPPATAESETVLAERSQFMSRLTIDRGTHALLLDGEVLLERVSVLEYRLLEALSSDAPNVVENVPLGDSIWGEGEWDTYMLHNLVRRVRRKLEEAGAPADELLVSVPGVGYRFA